MHDWDREYLQANERMKLGVVSRRVCSGVKHLDEEQCYRFETREHDVPMDVNFAAGDAKYVVRVEEGFEKSGVD